MRSKHNSYTTIFPAMLLFILLIFNTGCSKSETNGQHKFEGSGETKKRARVIEQEAKELEKQKSLKVKARYKYVTFYKYDGTLPEDRTLVEKVLFDKKGLRTEHIRYNALGEIDLKYTFTYNKNGKVTEMRTRDKDDMLRGKKVTKYDAKENIIEEVLYNQKGGIQSRSTSRYDKIGNVIEATSYTPSGEIINIQTFEHSGNKTKITAKSEKGVVLSEEILTHDDIGRVLTDESETPQGKILINYKYDEKGNIIEFTNPQFKRNYKYDEKSNLIHDEMFLLDGTRQFKVTFKYDKNGLQSEEIRYTGDDQPAFYGKYEYEFYK